MRARLIMAAAVAGLGFGFSQPAAAGGWDDSSCCAGTVYVHHHVYAPVRYRHVYHCEPVYAYRSWDYFAPRYWYWRGRHW